MDGLKNRIVAFLLALLMVVGAIAQDTTYLNLEKCLELAFQYNIAYNNSLQQHRNAQSRLQSAGASLLPMVSGFANQGISTGKSINPYTNSFINQEVTTGQYGLSASMNLFNGFSNLSNLQQSSFAKKATAYDVDQAGLDLKVQVTQAYVQVLGAEELLNQARWQLQTTEEQLRRLQSLHQQGAIAPAVLFDTKGQLANDKIAYINAGSLVVTTRMALSELINQEIKTTTKFEKLDAGLSAENDVPDAEGLYAATKDRAPMVQGARYRLRSTHSSLRASWGSAFPTLALVGNLGTNYSSAAVRQTVSNVFDAPGSSYVMVNGASTPVYNRQVEYTSEKIGFNSQLSNNLFTYVGLSLQVPIFNGLRNKQQIDLSKHAYEFSKIQQKGSETRFRSQLTVACNELRNSRERLVVYQEQTKDYEQSYLIAQNRFEKGAISTLEFISAKTNYEKALANSISAKYEYVFRKKVVELYKAL